MRLIIDSNMAKLPGSCHECPLGYGGFCDYAPAEEDGICPDEGRPEWCPMHAQDDAVRCKDCNRYPKLLQIDEGRFALVLCGWGEERGQ